MLILTNSGTDKLQLISGQAVALDVHVGWVDQTTTTITPGRTNTAISTATTTDIVATPSASTQRIVKHVNVRNTDSAASCDVTIVYDANGTDYTLYKVTLRAQEVLEYQEGIGWYVVSLTSASLGTASMWPDRPVSSQTSAMTAAHFNSAAGTTSYTGALWPMRVDQLIYANRIMMPVHVSITSASTTASWTFTLGHSFGLYTLNGASLSLLSSFSNKQEYRYSSAANSTNASAQWTMSFGSSTALSSSLSLSTNNAGNTSLWSSLTSVKLHPLAYGNFSVTPGQYFGMWAFSTRTSSANLASITGIGIDTNAAVVAHEIGTNVASTQGWLPLIGQVSFTDTNSILPAAIATSDVTTRTNTSTMNIRSLAIQMLSSF